MQSKEKIVDLYNNVGLSENVGELDALNQLLSAYDTSAAMVKTDHKWWNVPCNRNEETPANEESKLNRLVSCKVASLSVEPATVEPTKSTAASTTDRKPFALVSRQSQLNTQATPGAFSASRANQPGDSSSLSRKTSISSGGVGTRSTVKIEGSVTTAVASAKGKSDVMTAGLVPLSSMSHSHGFTGANVAVLGKVKREPSSHAPKKRVKFEMGN